MHRTVTTWGEFTQHWGGPTNFLMGGQCVPFDFEFPSLDRIVDELRQDEAAQIGTGTKGPKLLREDTAAAFRALPIDRAIAAPFSLGHFRLSHFDAPGKCLDGFKDRVLDRWQAALTAAGFTWTRCYPIIFISGPGCATNYHMDFSHVVAWQIHGTKRFCGLKNPDARAPRALRINYKPEEFAMPPDLSADEALCYDMPPGTVLWNALLTPHWVEAGDAAAMSVNLSHGGLRLHGKLCPFEQELEDYRQQNPEQAPKPVQGAYRGAVARKS